MRQPLVAGNWKLNGTRDSVAALTKAITAGAAKLAGVEIAVCPPFVFLAEVGGMLAQSPVKLGAQDVSRHASGAYTGEISGAMLREFGCHYVIVGHSERRTYHGESDELVADKAVAAHKVGLVPIICVGETLEEREAGHTEKVIARQLDALLTNSQCSHALTAAVIAYEPVWAIGTGRTATPQQAQEVHRYIRNRLAHHDAALAKRMQILYGGSVKADNAVELFAMADIDGGLIGGASLSADDFLAICQAARAK